MSVASGVRPRRRAIAWCCVAITLVVLAGAVFAGREAILERWYVYSLDSPDVEVRKQAIEKLGELGSERTIPRLIEIARTDDDLGPHAVAALVRGKDRALPELLSLLEWKSRAYLLPTVAVIERDGASRAAASVLLTIALHAQQGSQEADFQYVAGALERARMDLVPELIQALESGDELVRARAFQLLKQPVDARVIPVLCNLLGSETWSRQAASTLGSMGAAALPALALALEGEKEMRRRGAAEALGRMGAAASPLVPMLVRTLKDPAVRGVGLRKGPQQSSTPVACQEIGCTVAWALGKSSGGEPEVVEALASVLNGENGCLAWHATGALGEMRSPLAVPPLVAALKLCGGTDPEWGYSSCRIRSQAARALGLIGIAAAGAVPALIEALRNAPALRECTGLPQEAAIALGCVSGGSEQVVEALSSALAGDRRLACAAARGLGRLGPAATSAAPALAAHLDRLIDGDEEENGRGLLIKEAIESLGAIGSASPPVLSALRRVVASESLYTDCALKAVVGMGIPNEELGPLLAQMLVHPHSPTQHRVWEALVHMGEAALPLLKSALSSQDTRVRLATLSAIANLPLGTEQRVEILDRCLGDADVGVRLTALFHAANWGILDDRAVPHVLRALEDDDEENRRLAARICSRLKAHASKLVPALLSILDGAPRPGIAVAVSGRAHALHALASLAGDEPSVRKRILEALEDGEPWIRLDAVQAIGVLDRKDEVFHEALVRALHEKGPIADGSGYNLVRWAAAEQLMALGKTETILEALKSPDARLRRATLRFLRRTTLPGARGAMEAALIEEKDETIAEDMRRALRKLPE